MRDLFIKIKNLSIITIIAAAIIGIVLIAKPEQAVKIVSIMCGATVILLGVGAFISYFTKSQSTILAILGAMAIISGIVLCVKYQSIISVVIFIFGIFVIVSGVVDFISAIDAKKNDLKNWILSIIMSAATIILGLIVVINPFDSSMILVRLLGVALIVYAVMDIIAFVQMKKIVKYNLAPQIEVTATEHDSDFDSPIDVQGQEHDD